MLPLSRYKQANFGRIEINYEEPRPKSIRYTPAEAKIKFKAQTVVPKHQFLHLSDPIERSIDGLLYGDGPGAHGHRDPP